MNEENNSNFALRTWFDSKDFLESDIKCKCGQRAEFLIKVKENQSIAYITCLNCDASMRANMYGVTIVKEV